MGILKKLKEGLKNIAGKKAVLLPKKTQAKVKAAPIQAKKEVIGYQETAVERTKFSHSDVAPAIKRPIPQELPSQYGQDKIVLQVRDPFWIHAYWEVSGPTFERLKDELKDEFWRAKLALRVYDISHIVFDGKNAHKFFDIHINRDANNWYIDALPGRSWCVDLGLLCADGRFITIVRSNVVHTPLEGPSWVTDEEWMIPEDMFARLYGMGFGLGRSSAVGKGWQQRIISSGQVTSITSQAKKAEVRKFWLVVDTELIVYGATEPDAKLTVQGRDIKLRPDGTFTLRFALPDGRQVIPVKATSADSREERTITPIVTKETR